MINLQSVYCRYVLRKSLVYYSGKEFEAKGISI